MTKVFLCFPSGVPQRGDLMGGGGGKAEESLRPRLGLLAYGFQVGFVP